MDITPQQRYEILFKKTMNGMIWLDDPARTQEERDKWQPKIQVMFDEITNLEIERKLRNGKNDRSSMDNSTMGERTYG